MIIVKTYDILFLLKIILKGLNEKFFNNLECSEFGEIYKMKKAAFTLAEVLVTLGIIGVVASLTMPSLIQSSKEKEYVGKLKKFNSIMNQALLMAIEKKGMIEDWGLGTAGMSENPTDEEVAAGNKSITYFWDIVAPYLKVVSRCDYGDAKCESYKRYSLDGTEFGTFHPVIVLADGLTVVGTTIANGKCKAVLGSTQNLQNVCGELFVDVNGKKPPNTTGKDVFLFYYTKYGIVPMGSPSQASNSFTFENYCNINKSSTLNGYGCTAWVITNENMDYLHCNGLNWNGKTKCK